MAKTRKVKDPFASREAKKYDDPIPSREYILSHLEAAAAPIGHEALCKELRLKTDTQCEALRRRLIAMSRDGQLISNRRGVYGLAGRMELIKGTVQGSKDDYGFFIPADGSDDLYLSSREMQKVFDGDTVLARVSGLDNRGRKEGMIVEILQRGVRQIVGRYYSDSGIGILVPANRRINHEILVPKEHSRGAIDGQFVVGEITSFPSSRHQGVARIIEILGDSATPGLEIEIIVRSHDLPNKWPASVSTQLKKITDSISAADFNSRADLRQLPFVTIDGEDARDFDDAVYAESCQESGNIAWKLYVAIADVSHYVNVDSPLDEEALNRGTSVYFPGHVIPMLPEQISNGVCSLKPNQDRLVMICEMAVSGAGEVEQYKFYEGIIHSHARLTYTEVADILEPMDSEAGLGLQQRLKKRHAPVVAHLETLYQLYGKLRQARKLGGALDFETIETRIVFGENRRIKEIIPVVRNCAHRLIEECMLCANVAAGKLLQASSLPALYRVHDGPSSEKLEKLREYLRDMGLGLGGGDKPEPVHYQKLLQQIGERPDSNLLQTMVIRSMMQAVYQSENIGHFGLGFGVYAHFTSPIRRYPDLLVHRAIRFLIRNNKGKHVVKAKGAAVLGKAAIYPYGANEMHTLGENCSLHERRADAASYEVIDWLKCEYMQNHVGDEFAGTISAVTGFGLFVALESIYIEGLIHITALDNDYYHFDAVRHTLTGERTGNRYHMGDGVRVRVAAVNLDERKIDLVMTDSKSRTRSAKGKSDKKHSRSGKRTRPENAGNTKGRKKVNGRKAGNKKKSRKNT
ncbi:MAG: ribonuclease R [Gammaproteobacteria bacterium]|nr:ribonuclease R [Gammaproteobacteria bacterium]